MTYDNYNIQIKKRHNGNLVMIVEYIKNNKVVDCKRTPNMRLIKEMFNLFSEELESYSFLDATLIGKNNDNCSVVVPKYNVLKDKFEDTFKTFDEKVESISKKKFNRNSNNIKINKNYLTKLKKRMVLVATCGFFALTGFEGVDKCLDNLSTGEEVTIESDNYSFPEISVQGIENAVQEAVVVNNISVHTLEKNNAISISVEKDNSYHSVIPTFNGKQYSLSEEDFKMLVAVVEAEAGGYTPNDRYTDAMAVTCTVLNRLEDSEWIKSCGGTVVEQITSDGQFAGLTTPTFDKVYNDINSASPEVLQAVTDTLAGTRNSEYLSFRSKENKADGRVQFVKGGNNYFGKSNNKIEDSEFNYGKRL